MEGNFIQLRKTDVQNICLNEKWNTIKLYIDFHMNYLGYSMFTINSMCEDMEYKNNSKSNNNINTIKDNIIAMIEEGYYECNIDLNQISKNDIIKLYPKDQHYDEYFVSITGKEYYKLKECSVNSKIQFHKLLNVYSKLKSYLYVGLNDIMLCCYPSIKTLCDTLKCDKRTLFSIIYALCDSGLIYLKDFTSLEGLKGKNNCLIDYVFCFENYSDDEILQNLNYLKKLA